MSAPDRASPAFVPQVDTSPLRAVMTGLACIAAAAAARLMLEQVVPGVLPFLFTFPATIAATLLAGAIAGGTALAGCQILTFAFVLPHWIRTSGDRPDETINLLLATASLVIAVWGTAVYRRSQLGYRRRCEREVVTLSLMVNEIDHRTKNNFQLAAALLHQQAMAADPAVRRELDGAAARLVSIAAVYGNLSDRRPESGPVPLRVHLGEICAGLDAGLLPPNVRLELTGDEVAVPAAAALTIGLIVNEWITNAAKYAFEATAGGVVRIAIARRPGRVAVEVRDDGRGRAAGTAPGTGGRLIASLAAALDAEVRDRNDGGLVCTLEVPLAGN